MDREGRDLYPNQPDNGQAGLEVDSYHLNPKPAWGAESTVVGDYTTYANSRRAPERKTILGLSVLVFWGIIVLIVVLLAGGIGGGVGAGLASRKSSCSNSNFNGSAPATVTLQPSACTTPASSGSGTSIGSGSSASSTASAPASSVSPAPSSQCTDLSANGSTITPLDSGGAPIQSSGTNQVFRILCNTNYPGGANYGNPHVQDIFHIWTPDLNSCATLCAEYNAGLSSSGAKSGFCQVVSMVESPGQFCYLKTAIGINDTNTSGSGPYSSAMLI